MYYFWSSVTSNIHEQNAIIKGTGKQWHLQWYLVVFSHCHRWESWHIITEQRNVLGNSSGIRVSDSRLNLLEAGKPMNIVMAAEAK